MYDCRASFCIRERERASTPCNKGMCSALCMYLDYISFICSLFMLKAMICQEGYYDDLMWRFVRVLND